LNSVVWGGGPLWFCGCTPIPAFPLWEGEGVDLGRGCD